MAEYTTEELLKLGKEKNEMDFAKPNKLTDEQIIKALECCKSETAGSCRNCPLYKMYSPNCITVLAQDTIAFINRLTEQNEGLQEEVAIKTDMLNRQKAEIINRTEEYNDMLEQRNRCEECIKFRELEINILEMERNELHKIVAEQKAEIERLKKENEDITNQYLTADMYYEDNESKAVKEFAERLCEGRVANDPVVIAVNCELKEMVGEKDV